MVLSLTKKEEQKCEKLERSFKNIKLINPIIPVARTIPTNRINNSFILRSIKLYESLIKQVFR